MYVFYRQSFSLASPLLYRARTHLRFSCISDILINFNCTNILLIIVNFNFFASLQLLVVKLCDEIHLTFTTPYKYNMPINRKIKINIPLRNPSGSSQG